MEHFFKIFFGGGFLKLDFCIFHLWRLGVEVRRTNSPERRLDGLLSRKISNTLLLFLSFSRDQSACLCPEALQRGITVWGGGESWTRAVPGCLTMQHHPMLEERQLLLRLFRRAGGRVKTEGTAASPQWPPFQRLSADTEIAGSAIAGQMSSAAVQKGNREKKWTMDRTRAPKKN